MIEININENNSDAVLCGIITIIIFSLSGSFGITIVADPDGWAYLIANALFWNMMFILFLSFAICILFTIYAFGLMIWYEAGLRNLFYGRESAGTLTAMELWAMGLLSRDAYDQLLNSTSSDGGPHPSRWTKSEDTLVNVDLGETGRAGSDTDELTDLLEEEVEN